MRPTILSLSLLLVGVLVGTPNAWSGEKPKATRLPAPHGDALVKERLARFEKEYKADDLDDRIRIVKWVALHRHKKVVARLKKIWLKEKNLELVAAAGAGLGLQVSHPKLAVKALLLGLEKYRTLAGKTPANEKQRVREEIEANVLVSGLESYEALGLPVEWKPMKRFFDHNNDDVAIAMVHLCQARKDYRAVPVIYEWFQYYPNGASWSGGSVSVDTGAAGNADAEAARGEYGARYGGRAKKSRPNAFKAMVECIQVLTGEKIEKREQLKAWMKKNKALLKKHGA